MEDSRVSRRDALGAAAGFVAMGAGILSVTSATTATAQTPRFGAGSAGVAPGSPKSQWLLLNPDSNNPESESMLAAVDVRGITRAMSSEKKLLLVVTEAPGSLYSIEVQFAEGQQKGVCL